MACATQSKRAQSPGNGSHSGPTAGQRTSQLLAGGRAEHGRDDPDLSDAGRDAVDTALRIIAVLDADLTRIRGELVAFGRAHPGPRELAREYGLGALLATAVWEELGDTRRFSASRQAVRHAGLDISVYDSRRQTQGPADADPAGAAGAALGAVRGRRARPQANQPGPRLLHPARAADRLRPGTTSGGPQARPPLPPPAAGPS